MLELSEKNLVKVPIWLKRVARLREEGRVEGEG